MLAGSIAMLHFRMLGADISRSLVSRVKGVGVGQYVSAELPDRPDGYVKTAPFPPRTWR
jgi:hypothetical protein